MLTAAFHATSGADFRIFPVLAEPRHSVPGRKERHCETNALFMALPQGAVIGARGFLRKGIDVLATDTRCHNLSRCSGTQV